ncbi:MAG: serine/threonine-protein kinase [Planctomycetota bacterium]
MPDLTGQTLGDYHVLRRLGRGAMAEVYLAEQASLARRVALKVLSAELAEDAAYVGRFVNEARAAAALVHANIVQVYEVGAVGGLHFIAQEYVAGRNVGELIERQGRLDAGLTLDILRQVVSALHKAAECGIVHRDIKPENIMLARSGEVKVADFGLARIGDAQGANLTQVGVTMGTPLYMSPEQVEGRAVDSRSDIYSLGVTAHHMLAGEPPFRGDTPLAVAVQHLNSEPPPLDAARPDTPVGLARIVRTMMAKSPDARPASPASLLSDLRTLAKQAAAEGWAEGPENWSIVGLRALNDGDNAATAELARLMREASSARLKRMRWRRAATLVAACLVAGGLLAAALPRPAFTDSAELQTLAKPDVLRQLFHAKMVDTEPAWLAVEERFPDEQPYYHDLAEKNLASLLLRRRQHDRALAICQRLAKLDSDPAFRLFGLAGVVVCQEALGRREAAEQSLGNFPMNELAELEATSPQMAAMLLGAKRRLSGASV